MKMSRTIQAKHRDTQRTKFTLTGRVHLPNTLTEKKSAIETKTNHSLYGIIALSLYYNGLFNLYVNIW